LLRAHPNLSLTEESHFIPVFSEAFGDPGSAKDAEKLAGRILALQWVKSWGLSLEPASFSDLRSYPELVEKIYSAWAAKENKPRWGDVTPQYVKHLPVLYRLFPDARFLHIVRDGRDVALSLQRTHFGPTNVYGAALMWQRMVGAGRRDAKVLPTESYLEVRYEDLLRNTGNVIQRICDFLEEDFTEQMLRPDPLVLNTPRRGPMIRMRRGRALGNGSDHAFEKEIKRDNAYKWKSQMQKPDRIIFESVAGSTLQTLGYERTELPRKITRMERGRWRASGMILGVANRINRRNHLLWFKTDMSLRWAAWRACLR
jgi:hypothetical protein